VGTVNDQPLYLCTHQHTDPTVSWNPQQRHVTPQEVIELMLGDIDIIRTGLRRIDDDLVLHRSALRDLLRSLEDIPGARRER